MPVKKESEPRIETSPQARESDVFSFAKYIGVSYLLMLIVLMGLTYLLLGFIGYEGSYLNLTLTFFGYFVIAVTAFNAGWKTGYRTGMTDKAFLKELMSDIKSISKSFKHNSGIRIESILPINDDDK